MRVLEGLKPEKVFSYFEDICSIPHGSGNTQQISDYCAAFARDHHLRYIQEPCGNIIIFKDASAGYEDADTVMLQGHMDMVAVCTDACTLDLTKDGLDLAVTEDGEWIYAKETSLGGDDGIAIAYALAILADDTLKHPALEAVFTVDEEIGLLGAAALDASPLKSRILLNMDSEDDGIFLTSCAGGATFTCFAPAPRERMTGIVYEWCLDGLQGGHSGVEIGLGRANANVLFGRFLSQVSEKVSFGVSEFYGGGKDNVIAGKCRALLVAAEEDAGQLEFATAAFADIIKKEYRTVEPDLSLTLRRIPENEIQELDSCDASAGANVLTAGAKDRLILLLEHFPAGIQRMMPDIPDMVQTSLNLGILGLENDEMYMTFSVRSASKTEKDWLLKRLTDLSILAGGRAEISGVYPAWEYVPESRIQKVMAETFEEVTGEAAQLTGIHAGVECGLISEKMPGLDCISYGPQMYDIHSVRERLNIASVRRMYELTVRVLEKLR